MEKKVIILRFLQSSNAALVGMEQRKVIGW